MATWKIGEQIYHEFEAAVQDFENNQEYRNKNMRDVISEIKDEKITVLFIEPGQKPEVIEIENTLDSYQKLVAGYIECLPLDGSSVTIICNEEGKINQLPLNRALYDMEGNIYEIIAGNMIICSTSVMDGYFESLNGGQIELYKKMFETPEIFFSYNQQLFVIRESNLENSYGDYDER